MVKMVSFTFTLSLDHLCVSSHNLGHQAGLISVYLFFKMEKSLEM